MQIKFLQQVDIYLHFRFCNRQVLEHTTLTARGISQTSNNTAREIFTADIVTDLLNTLTGTVIFSGSNASLTGFGTKFGTELKEGDIVYNPVDHKQIHVIA